MFITCLASGQARKLYNYVVIVRVFQLANSFRRKTRLKICEAE